MQKIISYLKLFFVPASLFFIVASFTGAYFSSNVTVSGLSFQTENWVDTVNPGDVVINELMWMGSVGHTNDEWIELKNTTSKNIDISGWVLQEADAGTSITIPSGASISAGAYYLISNYSNTNPSSSLNVVPNYVNTGVYLSNDSLGVMLYKDTIASSNLIDTAGNGGLPLSGVNGANKQSMSRNSVSGDGTQAASWHTDATSNSMTYWDSVDGNYGTPGGPNV